MQDDSHSLVACIPRLRRYARALLGDRASADDLVQDTMERGWLKLSSWRQGGDMRAWLFGIMHNLHVDHLRQQAPPMEALTPELAAHWPTAAPAAGPDGSRLEIRDMQAALQQLPAEQREVLLLVALEEMTYEEVAAVLQIPPGTVMSRLSRARERLRLIMLGQPPATTLKVVK